jgi:hypothetical protein
MRRRLVLATVICCLSTAACGSSASKGAEQTPLITVASPPTSPGVRLNPSILPGQFHLSVFVVSVDLSAHKITVDPMAFLTGQAAKDAYKADHPGAKEGPPNDYYIKNTTKDHLTLPLAAKAVVKLVDVGGTNHTSPVKVPQSKLVGYPSLTIRPFVVTGLNGTITGVTETFVP